RSRRILTPDSGHGGGVRGRLNAAHIDPAKRLALTPEEKAVFGSQLAGILARVEALGRVDVSGVEPSAHAAAVTNVWREDAARPGLPGVDALRNAPAQRDHRVVVPKVVE
ncbi:MAG: Asp-tRNA(Asn)/Glu-tRNA(Gln) amidotransferase subunit GatC, partial [Opitutaceae bacterium]